MANGRSFLTREPPTSSAAAKLPWHTNHVCSPSAIQHPYIALSFLTFFFETHILPQHVTEGGSNVLDGFCTSSQTRPPPSNIRYLLAFGTIVNRF
ncbi:hypothetical protein E4T48_06096 [Aureobasidium sp. EXF-10727]|nr:hypothetical protein E4T48_06096 [Aureobasidium sp. EXF-10727]